MRRTTRTIGTVIAIATTAALALAGCTATGSSGNGEIDTSKVSTKITDKPVTLTLSYVNDPPTKTLIAGFEKKHPNVTVKATMVPFGDYIKSIKRSMSSDSPPDIAQFNSGAMRSLIPAGLILDLDPYVKAYGWKKSFPESTLSPHRSDKAAKQFGTGSLYAIPGGMSVLGVFYNKKLLSQAGVSGPPKTVTEFAADLKALKSHGVRPLSVSGLEVGGFQLWNALVNVLGNVQDYLDWVYGRPGSTIETAGAEKATNMIEDWVKQGYIASSASATSDSDALADFAHGKAAFLVTGNWNTDALSKSMGDNVGFFAMPGKTPEAKPVASGSSVAFSISSKTKHPNAAAAFLNYMSSPEAAQAQVDGGFLPVNTGAHVSTSGLRAEVAKSFAGVIDGAGVVPFPDSTAPGMIDKLESGIQGIITGHMTPDAFLKSLQTEWSSYHG